MRLYSFWHMALFAPFSLALGLMILVLVFPVPAHGDWTVPYHPNLGTSLGRGYDPVDPTLPFQGCVEPFKVVPLDAPSSISAQFSTEIVASRTDLYSKLGVSASVEARSVFVSGKATVDYAKESTFGADSLTWMLMVRADFGRFGADQLTLRESLRPRTGKQKDLQSFYQQCGKQIAMVEHRVAMAALVFSVSNLSTDDKESLSTSLSVSGGIPAFSGGVSGSYKDYISQVARTQHVSLSVHTIGGPGPSALAALLAPDDSLEKIRTTLAAYVAGIRAENAAPVSYSMSPISALGVPASVQVSFATRETALTELLAAYGDAQAELELVKSLDPMEVQLCGGKIEPASREGATKLLQKYRKEVGALARDCIQDESKCTEAVPDLPVRASSLLRGSRAKVEAYPLLWTVDFSPPYQAAHPSVPPGGMIAFNPQFDAALGGTPDLIGLNGQMQFTVYLLAKPNTSSFCLPRITFSTNGSTVASVGQYLQLALAPSSFGEVLQAIEKSPALCNVSVAKQPTAAAALLTQHPDYALYVGQGSYATAEAPHEFVGALEKLWAVNDALARSVTTAMPADQLPALLANQDTQRKAVSSMAATRLKPYAFATKLLPLSGEKMGLSPLQLPGFSPSAQCGGGHSIGILNFPE